MIKFKLFHVLFPGILLILTLVVCGINFQKETWLSGWDTLHPEFNFTLNFQRLITGVWRQEQGLGAIAGHSHMTDLPRVILLRILSFHHSLSFLRWFYIFLCLILGPLGVYYFLQGTIFKKQNLTSKTASFLGALFYLFNLSTLQHFNVPFEMFTTQFAAFGWLFLWTTEYLYIGKKRYLIFFSLISLLSVSMAYAATLWYVYFLFLVCYLVGLALFSDIIKKSAVWRRIITLILATFIVNCFWLLPNLYYLKNDSVKVPQAKINQLFSEDAFLHNLAFGTIKDTVILRNFLFKWQVYDFESNSNHYLLKSWLWHLDKPLVLPIGYFCFSLVIFGLIISFIKKEKIALALIPIFLISFILITNDYWLTKPAFNYLRNNPLFKEALRFPFTKFSLSLQFTYSLYFAIAIFYLINTITKIIKKEKIIEVGLLIIVTGLLSYYMLPVFSGNLINRVVKVKIPDDYFQLFSFFKSQPINNRIAIFPNTSFWGWEYYDWNRNGSSQGFQGAELLYFGIKQPILVRDFDRWSSQNENYYWEMSQAIYSRNLKEVENVLEKYQINWIILDENIIDVGDYKALFFRETEELFAQSGKIKPSQNFGSILVYKVNLETPVKDFVYLAQDLPQVNSYAWNNDDTAFADLGHYLSNSKLKTQNSNKDEVIYPFRSLFTNRKQEELEFEVEDKGESFVFSSQPLNYSITNYQLLTPALNEIESIYWTKDLQELPFPTPMVDVKAGPLHTDEITGKNVKAGPLQMIEIGIAKQKGYFSYDSDDDPNFFNQEPKSCDPFNTGKFTKDIIEEQGSKLIRFTSTGSSNCADISLPHFIQNQGYLVKIQHRHVTGKGLMFYVINQTSKNRVIETALPTNDVKARPLHQAVETSYFIIPPQQPYGQGYSLHFDNISIGREQTINDLGRVEVYPIPYSFLKLLKFQSITINTTNTTNASELITTNNFEVQHPNPSYYKISIANNSITNNSFLVLSQSYHQGWKAYLIQNSESRIQNYLAETFPFIFGSKIKEHVLINNWQNGWKLDQSTINNLPCRQAGQQSTIYLFFWPQLLEYLGFGFLFFGTVILIKKVK